MPNTTKTPADRQPKTGSTDDGHRFTIGSKTYTLPPVGDRAEELPASLTMDAVENPDDMQAQARIGFALLRLVADNDTLDALRSLSTADMMKIVGEWMAEGESEGSSER